VKTSWTKTILLEQFISFYHLRMKYDLAFGDEVYKNRSPAKTIVEQNRFKESELKRALRQRKGVYWEYDLG